MHFHSAGRMRSAMQSDTRNFTAAHIRLRNIRNLDRCLRAEVDQVKEGGRRIKSDLAQTSSVDRSNALVSLLNVPILSSRFSKIERRRL
jgi:hypothetical protein